jgi:hypothetical protein
VRRILLLTIGSLALIRCASYWPTLNASSSAHPADAYSCAASEIKALGYKPTLYDDDRGILEARKITRDAGQGMRYNELRRYDMLSLSVDEPREGNGSTLKVRAITATDIYTRRGVTQEGEPASPAVKRDAQAVLDKCGAGA